MTVSKTQEVKNFYSNDRLNKGYPKLEEAEIVSKQSDIAPPSSHPGKRFESFLPPIEVITEYEEFSPGILNKIVKMAQLEQEQRFAMEKITIMANDKARRLSAICGLMAVAVISASAVKMAEIDIKTSLLFAMIAFGSIFGISLLSFIKSSKYRNDRMRNNMQYNNNKSAELKNDSNPQNRNNNFRPNHNRPQNKKRRKF